MQVENPGFSYWTLLYEQAISGLRAYDKETDVCIVWSVLVSNRILQIVFVDQTTALHFICLRHEKKLKVM